MKAIALIPARGGSVRVPRKNIKLFHGRPIIEYSIELAQNSGLFSVVVVSTDDEEIAMVSLKAGAAVVWREPDDGKKGTQEVAADVLRKMPGFEEACVIYATAPLLLADDLRKLASTIARQNFAFTVGTDPLSDAGAAYWGRVSAFIAGEPLLAPGTAMVPLPPERVCDINTDEDWSRAEQLYEALRRAA